MLDGTEPGSGLSARLERRRLEAARRQAVSTPQRLRVLSMLIAGLAIALTVVGASALAAAWVTVSGVQQRAVPSILGMQRIHAWLSEADRSAANAYLAGGSEVTLSQLQYEADIGAASRELQVASEHNPGGGDTSQRLQRIAMAVDQYVGLVQTASVDDRLGLSVGTVYLSAGTSLMHRPGSGILAQVDALRGLYMDDLDRANRTLTIVQWVAAGYAVLAVLLLALLVHTQLFVRRRFRRRQNPRLLAATAVVLVVAAATGAGASQARQSVRSAEDQSYARVLNLWNARALLYDANGNESLSLIARDQGARTTADRAYQAETAQLVDRPLTDALMQDAARGVVGFNGMLADELRAASPGVERDAAVHVLQLYRKFLDVDAAVRAKAGQGSELEAITLALGTDQGQLVFAFADVDWYLGLAIQRLQAQFDDSMAAGERVLAATAAVELLALAVVALTLWGLRPRIQEFRAGGPRRTR